MKIFSSKYLYKKNNTKMRFLIMYRGFLEKMYVSMCLGTKSNKGY